MLRNLKIGGATIKFVNNHEKSRVQNFLINSLAQKCNNEELEGPVHMNYIVD